MTKISELSDGGAISSGDDAAAVRSGSTVRVQMDTFDAMPQVGGNPIVESGRNSDGEWTRWADGTQVCSVKRVTLTYDNVRVCLGTWSFPKAFVDNDIKVSPSINVASDAEGPNAVAIDATPSTDQIGSITMGKLGNSSVDIGIQRQNAEADFQSGDQMYAAVMAIGRWK